MYSKQTESPMAPPGSETGIFVETDVAARFLVQMDPEHSALRDYLRTAVCFTGFIQAAELLACAESKAERTIVDRVLFGMKVLGAHQRYAGSIADFYRRGCERFADFGMRDAIVLALAREARLPILTDKYADRYRTFPDVTTIEAKYVRPGTGSTQIAGAGP